MHQGLFVGIPEYVRIIIYSQTRKLLATSLYQRDNDTEDIVQDLLLFYLEKFYKKKEFSEAYVVTSLKNEAKRLIRVRVCKCSGLFLSIDDMETCPDELQISGGYEQSELNLLQIMTILNICMKKEVQVWTIKDNYRLGKDIQSKVLAFAFSLSAEIERNLISQRTKEALARLKANGKKLGRVYGSKNKKHILDGKEQSVLKLIHKGVPKTQVAKIQGVSIYTIYEFLKNKDL